MQRYTDEELSILLKDIESDCVERKESFSGDVSRRSREAVCAFSNDLPNHKKAGVLFVGAKDDGNPSGLKITDQLLLTLSDMKTDGNILPLPALTVEKRVLNGAEMAVVTVMPSDSPPVKYDGRIWVRTGPRRALANEQEERILNEKRVSCLIPYDVKPIPGARLGDISRTFFEEEYLPSAFAPDVLKENHRMYEERLASCKMVKSAHEPVPTFIGIISLGKKPQDFVYGSYIQFLRIDGSDVDSPIIDELEIKGRLTEIYKTAEMKFTAYNKRAFDVHSGPTHIISWDYPEAAFRQILCNAILHRNYDGTNSPVRFYWYNDRIEIMNPGGPYGDVTVENFGQAGITDYRNKNLADVMKNLDLVQRFGFGIQWAKSAMEANGNPPPEFELDNHFVKVVLRRK
ncbi:MAG: putative DNA binding domain-containing protein [Spirochaetia bacterium]|jgi:ATP-dependent DNA helicase RecG|nr:putative DNA binding domain-containing protein [Spirochaetia bacterium]